MMDNRDFINLISQYAPLLGNVISRFNPIAFLFINSIAALFEANSKDIHDITNKIMNDPHAGIKLKQLELQYQEILNKNQIDDRINAREREERIIELTGKRDWLLDLIAFVVICGYFVMCSFMVFNRVEGENNQVLFMMFGQLTGGFIMVLSYYFGSTKQIGNHPK